MKKLVTLIAALTLTACGSTGVLRVGNATPTPKPDSCHIVVFDDESDVGRPFEKLCLIDAKTGSTLYNNRSVSGAMGKVNSAACRCGADAVIVQGMEKKGVSLTGWGSSKVKVVAIRFTGPAPGEEGGLVGAKLVTSAGATLGEVLTVEKEHRFPDDTVEEAFLVQLTSGGTTWVRGKEARQMLPSPAPKE